MTVLTVGSGGDIGDCIFKFADKNGFNVISLDLDEARKPDVLGDICTTVLPSSKYDVVVICEVLEHLHSPHLALDNIYNSLKPGGKLIVSAPFCLPIHDMPHDYFRFTRFGLELLLKRFKQVTITERNTYFEAIDVIWMRIIMDNPSINAYISGLILPFIYYLKRPITLFLGRLIPLKGLTTGYIATAIK
ncbi:MAG: class I SAM-dependent methyltransferase [Saprospiraceae bacterium]|nr:class I SAM-dependent methyltransferase [Candidatus Brachybacter algidus]MBL0226737.1 class I SAM-dependent methyltransferase [Geobacteraceae bacterium]